MTHMLNAVIAYNTLKI